MQLLYVSVFSKRVAAMQFQLVSTDSLLFTQLLASAEELLWT